MTIKDKEYYSEIKFKDDYGTVKIRILNDLSQISLDTEHGDCYADVDRESLCALRDLLIEKLK